MRWFRNRLWQRAACNRHPSDSVGGSVNLVGGVHGMADDEEINVESLNGVPVQTAAQEPVSAVTPAGSSESAVDSLRLSIEAGFARLLDAFDQKLTYDKFKEEQVTRLHAELQQHKANLLFQAIRPFVQGIIRLHDDTEKILTALKRLDPAELTPERVFRAFDGLIEDLELVLRQNGVEAFREPGEQ